MLPKSKLFILLLYLPAQLYRLIISLRVMLYEHKYLSAKKLPAIVISVGNITVGGTGKTPLVAYLAQFLADEHIETAILSRGYRRKDSQSKQLIVSDGQQVLVNQAQAGDEPFMLAHKLKEVKVIVGSDRYQTGLLAIERFGTELLLLDDGFQHLQLARDLDIVVLDGTNPFDNGEMVPFGRLREPLYGLRRAQVVIVTRADRCTDEDMITNVIKNLGLNIPIIYAYHDFVGLRELFTNKPAPLHKLNGAKIAVICALGQPDIFLDDLAGYQAQVVSKALFRDHHAYTQADLCQATKGAQAAGAAFIVTTEKDAVKLSQLADAGLPIYVIEIKVEFEDVVKLKSLILRAVAHYRTSKKTF